MRAAQLKTLWLRVLTSTFARGGTTRVGRRRGRMGELVHSKHKKQVVTAINKKKKNKKNCGGVTRHGYNVTSRRSRRSANDKPPTSLARSSFYDSQQRESPSTDRVETDVCGCV